MIHSRMLGQIVRINPSTPAGVQAVRKFGNCFWVRPSSGQMTHLIPVKDGIPYVADFIIVPNRDIVRVEADVGFGQNDTPTPTQPTQDHKDA